MRAETASVSFRVRVCLIGVNRDREVRESVSTPREVALSVFVKHEHTNAKPLRAYDIVVAELESQTGEHLHDMLRALEQQQPAISRYLPAADAIFQTSALMHGKPPNQSADDAFPGSGPSG